MKLPRIGFGGYRIDSRVDEHSAALRKAILEGITLIDTSSNYADGRSEILIGNVVDELVSEKKIKREDLIIVSKAGYIQGQNLKFARKRKEQGKPFSDVVEHADKIWHCISPDFLEDQLNRQLFRLNQGSDNGYIDIYLLHNPEYYLTRASKNNTGKEKAYEEYYLRISKAFEFLEEKVMEGRIRAYGISSNTFISPSENYEFTSFEKILGIAEDISAENNFRFVQFPLNLIEAGALLEKNQNGNTRTLLETVSENKIQTLVNRPLNSVTKNGLIRLAEFDVQKFDEDDFHRNCEHILLAEDDFANGKIPNTGISEADKDLVISLFDSGKKIYENWNNFGSVEHLNDLIEHYFSPRINYLMDYFEDKITDDHLKEYFDKYLVLLFRVMNQVSNYYKHFAAKRSRYINGIIDAEFGEETKGLTLSQKAIHLVGSLPGVDCVLVGARKEDYVDDIKPLLKEGKISGPEKAFIKIRDEIEKIISAN